MRAGGLGAATFSMWVPSDFLNHNAKRSPKDSYNRKETKMSYKPEYKEGDLVRIREWNALVREFGLDDCGYLKGHSFDKDDYDMLPKDRVCKIFSIRQNGMLVKNYFGEFPFVPYEFLEGHAFEYGDLIEVSNDGKSWYKRHYLNYLDHAPCPYIVCRESSYTSSGEFPTSFYKYARKLKQERPLVGKECKVTCDGIEYDVVLK